MWVCRDDIGVAENKSPWCRGDCQAVQQPGLLDLREDEAPGEPVRSAPQLLRDFQSTLEPGRQCIGIEWHLNRSSLKKCYQAV